MREADVIKDVRLRWWIGVMEATLLSLTPPHPDIFARPSPEMIRASKSPNQVRIRKGHQKSMIRVRSWPSFSCGISRRKCGKRPNHRRTAWRLRVGVHSPFSLA
jgi:hypothetical protein